MWNRTEMLLLLIGLCWIAPFVSMEATIITDDVILSNINKNYVNPEDCSTSVVEEDNDWPVVDVNLAVIQDIPCSTMINFQLLEYSEGDYTLETGIEFSQTIENFLTDKSLVGPVLKAFDITTCPITPGLYKMENFRFESNAMTNFPIGEFKALVQVTSPDNEELFTLEVFCNIDKL